MKTYFLLSAAVFLAATMGTGCAGVDARREQRWAAFDPLRPDPEFRLLPDRPLLKFGRSKSHERTGAEAPEMKAPLIWKSAALDSHDLTAGASRFHPAKFELYIISDAGFSGCIRARALNGQREEVGRSEVALERKPDEAGWVVFPFPERFAPGEVEVIAVELAE